MIKGIVFDLDGTLLNTITDLMNAVNYALEKVNVRKITYDQTRQYTGRGIKNLVLTSLGNENEEKLEEAFVYFKDYYGEHPKDFTIPYDGIIELVENLSNRGYKLAIVSNKYQQGVTSICSPIFGKFIKEEHMIGGQDDIKLKPAPDMIFLACKKLSLSIDECIFVGDSETDAMAAKNANMKVCGVSWGFRDSKVLIDLKVDYLINKPNELLDILKGVK